MATFGICWSNWMVFGIWNQFKYQFLNINFFEKKNMNNLKFEKKSWNVQQKMFNIENGKNIDRKIYII